MNESSESSTCAGSSAWPSGSYLHTNRSRGARSTPSGTSNSGRITSRIGCGARARTRRARSHIQKAKGKKRRGDWDSSQQGRRVCVSRLHELAHDAQRGRPREVAQHVDVGRAVRLVPVGVPAAREAPERDALRRRDELVARPAVEQLRPARGVRRAVRVAASTARAPRPPRPARAAGRLGSTRARSSLRQAPRGRRKQAAAAAAAWFESRNATVYKSQTCRSEERKSATQYASPRVGRRAGRGGEYLGIARARFVRVLLAPTGRRALTSRNAPRRIPASRAEDAPTQPGVALPRRGVARGALQTVRLAGPRAEVVRALWRRRARAPTAPRLIARRPAAARRSPRPRRRRRARHVLIQPPEQLADERTRDVLKPMMGAAGTRACSAC